MAAAITHVVITHLNESSRTVRCGAKQAMAHTFISIPEKNCLPLMSHTPCWGVAWAFVRPPYWIFGAGITLPWISAMRVLTLTPNICRCGSALKFDLRT